jgi:uncharacterized protein (TIGR02996 family)
MECFFASAPGSGFRAMSDRAAFLAAIVSRPDDDLPRLIYADYLDEQGEESRAEYIRWQCALARGESAPVERVAALEAGHRDEWLAPLGPSVYHAEFRRGFPEHIVTSAREFLSAGSAIRAQTPLRGVALLGAGRVLAQLLAGPHLAGLSAIHLTGGMLGNAGIERLAECPHLAGLRTLRLGQNEIGDSGAAALANSSALEELRVLVLNNNEIGDAGAWELARSPYFRQLRALDVSNNDLSPTATAMLESSHFLESLADFRADDQRPVVSRWRFPAMLTAKN